MIHQFHNFKYIGGKKYIGRWVICDVIIYGMPLKSLIFYIFNYLEVQGLIKSMFRSLKFIMYDKNVEYGCGSLTDGEYKVEIRTSEFNDITNSKRVRRCKSLKL